MLDGARVTDDETMKCGLLMESAQVHQKLADVHLEKLRVHTQELDDIVRDEIRRTLIEELHSLGGETERAARALRGLQRSAQMRSVLWNIGLAVLCTAAPAAFARWVLPSAADVAALRAQRDALTQSIASLEQAGGKVDWRNCGKPQRLCVRVDRKAPVYGEKSDYYVVLGN